MLPLSRPSRARGLKPEFVKKLENFTRSRASGARGLKQAGHRQPDPDARIEIAGSLCRAFRSCESLSRSLIRPGEAADDHLAARFNLCVHKVWLPLQHLTPLWRVLRAVVNTSWDMYSDQMKLYGGHIAGLSWEDHGPYREVSSIGGTRYDIGRIRIIFRCKTRRIYVPTDRRT